MKKPNVKDYDLKPYGYIGALTRYIEYLETKIDTESNLPIHSVVQQSEPCKHPRNKREYVGEGYLKCKLCGETFK